jgi:fido (protein-threonine AMPylation protein)
VFSRYRIKCAHNRFLESCRSVADGADYWEAKGKIVRGILRAVSPVPLIGLHEEGAGLLKALDWLEDHCRRRPLGEPEIQEYHRAVFTQVSANPGEYRAHGMRVQGRDMRLAKPAEIRGLMKRLHLNLLERQRLLDSGGAREGDVLREAVEVYHAISVIHPFDDGNGRVARLSMNHLMRRYGFGYVILPRLGRSAALWDALGQAHAGSLGPLVELARRCIVHV